MLHSHMSTSEIRRTITAAFPNKLGTYVTKEDPHPWRLCIWVPRMYDDGSTLWVVELYTGKDLNEMTLDEYLL